MQHYICQNCYYTIFKIGQFSYTNVFANGSYGVCHTDELIYMWEPLFESLGDYPIGPLSGNDIVMREMMLETWTNFATYGDPTPPDSGLDWLPQLSNSEHLFWYISSSEPTMTTTPEIQERWKIWHDMLG